MTELQADLAVVGGGVGGVAAALAAVDAGLSVVLTEDSDWLGGQLTSQAVPPDENPWIEQFGCTARYRTFRDAARDHYRRWYPLSEQARAERHLNPGRGVVSTLCIEPRVALAVLEGMLAPARASGRLRTLLEHRPVAAETDGDRVRAVVLTRPDGQLVTVTAPMFLDATETGELLELSGTEHVTGAESVDQTGEPHAKPAPEPRNMQAVSWCFAIEHLAGEDHTIDRPARYTELRDAVPAGYGGPQLSFVAPVPRTGEPHERTFTPNADADAVVDHTTVGGDFELWTFRRIAARQTFRPGWLRSDVTMVNWPMIDYLGGPVFGGPDDDVHLAGARELSLSFLYWLQTEAPRPDGGTGYPGLRLLPEVVGTADGLAKRPYIRESRRIRAQHTIVEQEVALAGRPDGRAVRHEDSVGIGSYRIDLHPSTGGDGYLDVASCPFQIPLRALVPVRVTTLLPAAKNIGTTHITTGCYRLHPVEWNIGEAAATLAALCLERRCTPQDVTADPALTAELQRRLAADGVELDWPDVRAY